MSYKMSKLNPIGQSLLAGLSEVAKYEDAQAKSLAKAEKVNVVGVGEIFTAAYEQLRNAAENAEEHLLLQNAIRRFYRRLFITQDQELIDSSGGELAIELTYAGYIPNNSLTKKHLSRISKLASRHFVAYEKILSHSEIDPKQAMDWALDTLASSVAEEISPQRKDAVLASIAYQHFSNITYKPIASTLSSPNDFGAVLFIAICRSLLKSNQATIRTALLERFGVDATDYQAYITYNQQIDSLLDSPDTDKLYHIVDKHGAPFRILKRMIADQPDIINKLPQKNSFLSSFERQISTEYASIMTKVNRAIVRSVIFLIVTKVIVGLAIEIPYDLWLHGAIIWLPLAINLFFPPVYMVALRLTLRTPGRANTQALVKHIDSILYGKDSLISKSQLLPKVYNPAFSAFYGLSGLAVFSGVVWLLLSLGFDIVHILIFFLFISTASFLGFRLSRLIREIEVIRSTSNGLTFVRDLVYLPFVVVGRWMSEKYAKINVVALVLDVLIELPLKTILRLIRQWGAFIDDRKDSI